MMQEHLLSTPEATHAFACAIGRACRGGERIALHGEMGAGKTAFVRGLAEGLGIDPREISSPTFTVLMEHAAASGRPSLVHADAWRLDVSSAVEELEHLGWDELMNDAQSVIALEWASHAGEAFGVPTHVIELLHCDGEPEHRRAIIRYEASSGLNA